MKLSFTRCEDCYARPTHTYTHDMSIYLRHICIRNERAPKMKTENSTMGKREGNNLTGSYAINWLCQRSLLAKKRWCTRRMRSHTLTHLYTLLSVFISFSSQRSVLRCGFGLFACVRSSLCMYSFRCYNESMCAFYCVVFVITLQHKRTHSPMLNVFVVTVAP